MTVFRSVATGTQGVPASLRHWPNPSLTFLRAASACSRDFCVFASTLVLVGRLRGRICGIRFVGSAGSVWLDRFGASRPLLEASRLGV